jgi:3-polyprenyl-4-hydroxybenzoate decarboxylase
MPYPYRTFRDWFDEEEKRGGVVRIKKPFKCGDYSNIVDIGNNIPGKIPETNVRALARYLHSLPGKPMAIVENPIDNRPDIPVVINPFPTRERVLTGMGFKDKEEMCRKLADIPGNRVKPVKVARRDALCKQVIIPEDKIDLKKDVARIWVEFNQCLWNGCNGTWVTYDPETKTHGLAKTRLGMFEWENANPRTPSPEERVKKYGFATVARRGRPIQGNAGKYLYAKYRSQNKPMPSAFVYGLPPDIQVIAAFKLLKWPETGDEYEAVGSLRGEPLELVESETVPGMMVPAEAEWVIEGEFLTEDYLTPPFGEDVGAGMMIGEANWPIFRVKCITHRKGPWWTGATFSSNGLNGHLGTHTGLVISQGEVAVINYLRSLGFRVKDVVVVGGLSKLIIQMEVDGDEKPEADYGKKVCSALAGSLKLQFAFGGAIVVGPDINPYDLEDVMWAMCMRGGFRQDIDCLQRASAYEAHVAMMTPKPGFTESGLMVRTEPAAWEQQAIARMQHELG